MTETINLSDLFSEDADVTLRIDCNGETPTKNKWCVSVVMESADDDYPKFRYLHTDGVWRDSTVHNGIYSGYFPSYEAVIECLVCAEAVNFND